MTTTLSIGWGYVVDNYEAMLEAIQNNWDFSLCGSQLHPSSRYAQLWEDAAEAEALRYDAFDYGPDEDYLGDYDYDD